MNKTSKELEEMFGISPERIAEIDSKAASGSLDGVPKGLVVMGRPRLFGEHMGTISFKETDSRIEQIDRRAKELGLKRSDYMRSLVDKDLAAAEQ